VARVAKARAVPEAEVARVVAENTAKPMLGFIGEPRVNVLALNMALDNRLPRK
jgi:K+-transporting ATPase ATPase C chain